jgi:hypothetical protein
MRAGGRRDTRAKRNARSEAKAKQYAEGALARYSRTQRLVWSSHVEAGPCAMKYVTCDLAPNGRDRSRKLTFTVELSNPASRTPGVGFVSPAPSPPPPCARLTGPVAPVGPAVTSRTERLESEPPPHDPRASTSAEIAIADTARTAAILAAPREAQGSAFLCAIRR